MLYTELRISSSKLFIQAVMQTACVVTLKLWAGAEVLKDSITNWTACGHRVFIFQEVRSYCLVLHCEMAKAILCEWIWVPVHYCRKLIYWKVTMEAVDLALPVNERSTEVCLLGTDYGDICVGVTQIVHCKAWLVVAFVCGAKAQKKSTLWI